MGVVVVAYEALIWRKRGVVLCSPTGCGAGRATVQDAAELASHGPWRAGLRSREWIGSPRAEARENRDSLFLLFWCTYLT